MANSDKIPEDELCGECCANPCECDEDGEGVASCANCGEHFYEAYLTMCVGRKGGYCETCIEDLHLTPDEPGDGDTRDDE